MIELMLAAQDDGRTIDLPYDETLRIQLAESPTTGYRWQVEVIEPAAVESQASSYSPKVAGTAGGSGVRTFDLRAKDRGTTRVRFTLRREWQKAAAPQEQFEVVVHVI